MKQLVQSFKNGDISIVDVPMSSPGAREVQIRTELSLISAGTERMLVSFGKANMIQKAKSQPDKVRQVIDKVKNEGLLDTIDAVSSKLDQPTPLGYSNVGIVIKVGKDVSEFHVGDRVVSNGRHVEIVNVGVNLVASIPTSIPSSLAAFSVVGSIGLQGIRLLKPDFGETVIVYGAGLIGLLAIQMLVRNGCKVIAADIDKSNLKIAKKYGAQTILTSHTNDFESQISKLNSISVIDAVLITAAAKNDNIIKNSCKVLRKRGRIVLTGVVNLKFDRAWLYEKEISFQVSSSYGPGRYEHLYEEKGLDYPISFVRWTEKRNISSVLEAMESGWINVKYISSSNYDFTNSSDAYEALTSSGEDNPPMAILLHYEQNAKPDKSIENSSYEKLSDSGGISVIGAGNYATRRMLPSLKKHGANIIHIVSKGGLSSTLASIKFNARYSTVNIKSVLSDNKVKGVCVATRHDSHAPIVINAVRNKKFVFVEKPLAINISQLNKLKKLNNDEKGRIFVGFNREFSPHIEKMKSYFDNDVSNKIMILEMNAGNLPIDHWTQDLSVGGGRLIGETIHYISLAQYISNSDIKGVFVESLESANAPIDSFVLTLKFANADLASIVYYSNGSSKYKKESIKCIGGGKVFEIDNFKSLKGWGVGVSISKKSFRQEKGQDECFKNFVGHVNSNQSNDIERVGKYIRATEISIRASDILHNSGRGEFIFDT